METITKDPVMARPGGPLRILVSLGTIKPYRFDALVDRVIDIRPVNAQVTWQLGATSRPDLPESVAQLPNEEFLSLALEADVVITHGGVGTALSLIEIGKRPIIVPRRRSRNEHVDDHQVQIAVALQRDGAAIYREVEDLSSKDLLL